VDFQPFIGIFGLLWAAFSLFDSLWSARLRSAFSGASLPSASHALHTAQCSYCADYIAVHWRRLVAGGKDSLSKPELVDWAKFSPGATRSWASDPPLARLNLATGLQALAWM
jgi:hypothetical protein